VRHILTSVLVQFTKGEDDMTMRCQNCDELCSSIENSENSGKR